MFMIPNRWVVMPVVALAACSAPEFGDEIEVFSAAGSTALDRFDAAAAPLVAVEHAAARANAIAGGDPVFDFDPIACGDYLTAYTIAGPSGCALSSSLRIAEDAGSAHAAVDLTASLRSYMRALSVLIESGEPGEIEAAAQLALRNAGALAATLDPGNARSATFSRASGPFGSILGTYFEAWRLSQVRRVLRQTDPVIEEATRSLAAMIEDHVHPEWNAVAQRLLVACTDVVDPDTDDIRGPDYAAMLARCEAAQAEFARLDAETGRAAILAIAATHRSLLEAARARVDIDRLLKLAENLRALETGLQGVDP
ncbi:MAG: hypothetical protein AAF293_00915 [Pseudomonadota bacterium]